MRGYFVPQTTGTYQFSLLGQIDDLALIWLGDSAVSGYALDNALVYAGVSISPQTSTFSATVGEVIPIRIAWLNAEGCASLLSAGERPSGQYHFG